MNLSDTVVSYIRTYTPALAGLVIGWLVARGLPVDPGMRDGLTAVLSGAFIAAWYAGVRYAEKRWPAAGWLLGVPKAPAYGTEAKGAQVTGGRGLIGWTAPGNGVPPKTAPSGPVGDVKPPPTR